MNERSYFQLAMRYYCKIFKKTCTSGPPYSETGKERVGWRDLQ